jgi:hypothetical protein
MTGAADFELAPGGRLPAQLHRVVLYAARRAASDARGLREPASMPHLAVVAAGFLWWEGFVI